MSRHRSEAPGRILIGLVGCVKKKVDHASPARDLYVSLLFLGRRAAVEGRADRWFILSAEHGLVEPDQRIEPYERSLAAASVQQRRQWASGILASLRARLGDIGDYSFEIHAGRNYFAYGLRDGLLTAGAEVVVPTEGLAQGEQLQYYAGGRGRSHRVVPTGGRATPIRGRYESIEKLLHESKGEEVRVTFAQVEKLIGSPLPPSARRHPAWWHSLASALGWRASPQLNKNAVLFRRRTADDR
jgi:hypothetical protein